MRAYVRLSGELPEDFFRHFTSLNEIDLRMNSITGMYVRSSDKICMHCNTSKIYFSHTLSYEFEYATLLCTRL